MVEGWKGQDAGPDRLWRVAIREPGGQTAAVDTPSGLVVPPSMLGFMLIVAEM
jgi:hypothetical protein